MDSIFSYEKKSGEDFYALLGCDELSTCEQINAEYKCKALKYHPDKHPDNPDAGKFFACLTEARETLCDAVKRKQYDQWRNCGMAMSYKEWCARKGSVQTTLHWAVKKKKEPALEEAPKPEGAEDGRKVTILASGGASRCGWERDEISTSSLLSQFRNYQI